MMIDGTQRVNKWVVLNTTGSHTKCNLFWKLLDQTNTYSDGTLYGKYYIKKSQIY